MTQLPENLKTDLERRREALTSAAPGGPPSGAVEYETVIIGCGNLLRSDDAAGPIIIRHLWERGLDQSVRLVDGGTAGMDVGFAMQGAKQVILIDACRSGAEPGTLFRVPGEELEELPDLRTMHSHSFRWDHALAFGRWLLKDKYPETVEVWLIEAEDTSPGFELSPKIRSAVNGLVERLAERFQADRFQPDRLQADNES